MTLMTNSKSSSFNRAYQRLNSSQKKAVDAIEGPVMVMAGPGTGKTQVLATRIAHILHQTDTDPQAILALTFTDSAAANMRERLVKLIGKTGYYVHIHTFHSFCKEIIQTHPEYFPIKQGSQPLTDLERYELLQKLIDQTDLELLRPLNAPYLYLKTVIRAISDLKREGINLKEFQEILEQEAVALAQAKKAKKPNGKPELTLTAQRRWQRQLDKNQELFLLYQAYEQQLRQVGRYDFDDMIALVVEAFTEHQLLLREYQENLHYFLVDEYQDTNSAQNQVVIKLADYWGQQANIFVVGDPNQAIYRFQGASLENILEFQEHYPQALVVQLDQGYRCPQALYDSAQQVIKNNQLVVEPEPIQGYQSKLPAIRVLEAPAQTLELVWLAQEISKLLKQGVKPNQIAVLYRHNADEAELAEVLAKWELDYEITGGANILEQEYLQQLFKFFQVLVDLRSSSETEEFFQLMLYPWVDLDELLVMQLARVAGKSRQGLVETIQAGFEPFSKKVVGKKVTALEFNQLEQFLNQLLTWSSLDAKLTFPAWFEQVIKESGYLDWILSQDNKPELLNQLNSLFGQIKALVWQQHDLKLAGFLQAIQTMQAYGLKLNVDDLNLKDQAVNLATVHKAKGLEWDYVFLLHVVDGKWGNNRHRELIKLPAAILKNTDLSKKERNEDDRRLFYVALTRAAKQVTITYPRSFVQEGRSKETTASLFLEELPEFTKLTAQSTLEQASDHLAKLLAPAPARPLKTAEQEFFQALVKDFRLSVTALNTYLRDPQEFVDNFLLRVPRAKPIPMAFGSAVHAALEQKYKFLLEQGHRPPLKKFLQSFAQALKQEVLTPEDYRQRLAHGQEILKQYYQHYQDEQVTPLFVERFFGTGWSKTVLDDIVLTGRIDRIDWLDKNEKTVCVIDYKTGRPKSKNEIEGKTVSANLSEREQSLPVSIRGPYKRQLLFYKLLTELDRSFIPTATKARFDFIEPVKRSNKFVRREFILDGGEVAELKKLIKEVMQEIRGLSFLEQVTDN
ncbi:MAG: AAA family ATPase [Candidatus Pacebacteria bacterium]|nr:AAA family ATPase [Candidatus Paceibacterota bacterium]